ncbi:zinc-binding dehydrogenase [Streptomyces sp. NPDC006602]|uniref:zinc-binding dehydrogenase n=1 Tax=Streptomyces sp. NPDC006602 TaxID=3364751 RepID=UPI0036971999
MPLAVAGLSGKIRKQAKNLGETYEFLFIHAGGDQLRQVTALVGQGMVRPVLEKVPGFDQAPQAWQSLSHGGVRGKASHHRQQLIQPRPRRAAQTAPTQNSKEKRS